MRKESSNQFTEGLICDLNPINTPNTVLTDALNATIITYDGNEYSLQNDRGNYQLKNCRLKPNYIPVGLKEYGDILYIVSYNPIDNHVEIGTYPSPLNVESSDDTGLNMTIDSVVESIKDVIDYSELIKACKLHIYTGADEERFKIFPGDKYQIDIVDKSPYAYEELEYYIIDENRKKYNVTNVIQADAKWHNVPWQVPGWLAAQYHIGNFEEFNLNIRSFVVPKIVEGKTFTGKLNLNFQFKISDHLFLPLVKGTDAEIKKSESTIKSDIRIALEIKKDTKRIFNDEISLSNGEFIEWYLESKNLWMNRLIEIENLTKNSTVSITATPVVVMKANGKQKKIYYDNLVETYSIPLSNVGSASDFTVTGDLWRFYTDPDAKELYLEYDVNGPFVTTDEVSLYYRVTNLVGDEIIPWKIVDGYAGISDQVMSFIPYNDSFTTENMYILEFAFASGDSIFETTRFKKLIITSSIFGEFSSKYRNFNEISFDDWAIASYNKSISIGDITVVPKFTATKDNAVADHYWDANNGNLKNTSGTVFSNEMMGRIWNKKSSSNKGWVASNNINSFTNTSVNVKFTKSYTAEVKTTFKKASALTGALWENLPGIEVDVIDHNNKIMSDVSYSLSRNEITDRSRDSIFNVDRGKVQTYSTYTEGDVFSTLQNITRINEVKAMWLTVDFEKNNANDKLKFTLYDNGSIKYDDKFDTSWTKSSGSFKSGITISETSLGISNNIASSLKSMMGDKHIGVIGIRYAKLTRDSSKTNISHGGSVIKELRNNKNSSDRLFTYLVLKSSSNVDYVTLIPMSGNSNLWDVKLSDSATSWFTSSVSNQKLAIGQWCSNLLSEIYLCTNNNSINDYRLVKIRKKETSSSVANLTYTLEVKTPQITEWKVGRYNLLNPRDREDLITTFGEQACGKLLTSDEIQIDECIFKSVDIKDNGEADVTSAVSAFDTIIEQINSYIREPDTVDGSLLTSVRKRGKHKGVYTSGVSSFPELISELDKNYASTNDTYLTSNLMTTGDLKVENINDNDYLVVSKVTTALSVS